MKKLAAVLVFALFLTFFPAGLRATGGESSFAPSPFPTVISDSEVQEKLEEFQKQSVTERRITWIDRFYLVHGDQRINLRDTSGQYDFKILQKGDRFEYYVAIIGQSNYEGAYAEYQIAPPVLNLLTPGKERIPANASDATVFPLTLKRQEEPNYDENTVLQETQDGEWVVRFNKVPKVQYMKAVAEVQEDSMIGLSFFNPPGIKSSKNQPGGVSTSFFFVSGFYLPVHTHFHYVDDLSYRRVLNLSVDAPPAERSAGDGKDSNRSHVQLKVADLREEVKTSSYFGRGGLGNRLEVPFLRPSDASADSPEQTQEPDIEQGFGFKKEKPALQEVETIFDPSTASLVYMGNDIDKQENNNRALPGIVEGKLSFDKHYYLLYRAAAPYTVKGIKVADDDSNKRLGGARFALYFLNEVGEEILIRENLSTNSNGELCLSQKHTVEEVLHSFENGQLKPGIEGRIDVEKNVFNWDEDLFLYPGKYMLKETQAPEGYRQAEKPFEFEVQSGSSPAEVVEIQLPNERDPNAPPPPDPAPDPDPAPTPDPKPDQPDVLHPPGYIKPLLPQKTDPRPALEDHFQTEKPQRDSVPQTGETQSGAGGLLLGLSGLAILTRTMKREPLSE